MKNTFTQREVKILTYKEKKSDAWYATALEFNLTVDGDNSNDVIAQLYDQIEEYIISARELDDMSLLNQEPDPNLLEMWQQNLNINNNTSKKKIRSPYIAEFVGIKKLNTIR